MAEQFLTVQDTVIVELGGMSGFDFNKHIGALSSELADLVAVTGRECTGDIRIELDWRSTVNSLTKDEGTTVVDFRVIAEVKS